MGRWCYENADEQYPAASVVHFGREKTVVGRQHNAAKMAAILNSPPLPFYNRLTAHHKIAPSADHVLEKIAAMIA
jgi:hypothetical protein